MIQECSKNIEKLEFKPIQKKLSKEKSNGPSPGKQATKTASVCLVDLSKNLEEDETNLKNKTEKIMFPNNKDQGAIIKDEEMEEPHQKKIPNISA